MVKGVGTHEHNRVSVTAIDQMDTFATLGEFDGTILRGYGSSDGRTKNSCEEGDLEREHGENGSGCRWT